MLNWPPLQIITGLGVLSLLVFIHEAGHFLLARLTGVRVFVFSIGFGKKILRWQRGETEYCISIIPFGGYVKLAGQDPEDDYEPDERDYRSKKIWQRSAIVLAGPVANYLFGVLILWMIFMVGVHERENLQNELVVGCVMDSSAAGAAGIQAGDRIITVDGKKMKNWDDYYTTVFINGGREISLKLFRNGKEKDLRVIPEKKEAAGIGSYGYLGICSMEKAVVGGIIDSSAAALAGIMPGDTILSINGREINAWAQMVTVVERMSKPGVFRIKRGDAIVDLNITPRYYNTEDRYMIGISRALPHLVINRYGPVIAAQRAVMKTNDIIFSIWRFVRALFHKSVSPRSMAGPVGIVQMAGSAVKMGFDSFVFFIALISVSLGVFNLLPLAITDGGVLLFLVIEKLRGKPFSPNLQMRIQQAAFFFFIALFLFVTFNDIARIAG